MDINDQQLKTAISDFFFTTFHLFFYLKRVYLPAPFKESN